MENNYTQALVHYNVILKEILKKPDYESIMAVFCMYRLNNIDEGNKYVNDLILLEKESKFSFEYLSLILFFKAYFNKEDKLDSIYKVAEEYMPGYKLRGSYIQEIAQSMHDGNFTKKQNRYITDPSLTEYIL
jgi:hypothetical protein